MDVISIDVGGAVTIVFCCAIAAFGLGILVGAWLMKR